MSILIEGMKLPQHAAVNGEKDTAYKCVILAHPDNSAELVIDSKFASPYDNDHKIQRYPLTELPAPHGRLIDADELVARIENDDAFYEYGVSEELKQGLLRAVGHIIETDALVELD